jgi:hypothetical protein
MLCAGVDRSAVCTLLPGYRSFDFRLYWVDFDEELAAIVLDRCTAFWEKHVKTDTPPESGFAGASLECLKRVIRDPESSVQIDPHFVAAYQAASEAVKGAEKVKAAAQEALIAALGTAEFGDYGAGKVSYKTINRKGFTVEPTSFRQLRVTPAKKG